MRKLMTMLLMAAIIFQSCGTQTGSPKATVNNFLTAMKSGEIKDIKKYITDSDVKMIEMAEALAKSFGQEAKMSEEMKTQFKEKASKATFEVKDEKVEGDNATVNVAVTEDGKTETHPFQLKKEKGEWKISLISTGMNSAGLSNEDMKKGMDEIKDGIDELKKVHPDSLSDMFKKGAEEMKKINPDSLAEKLKEGSKQLEKIADEMKKVKTN